EIGLARLEELFHPASSDFWFLVPGDHPSLDPFVARQLIDACSSNPRYSVFIPVHEGKRGHPALLKWDHVARIREFPRDQGLNLYLRERRAETMEVPTDSISILQDLATPGDYAKLAQDRPLPS